MIVYRISKKKWAKDLSGKGAENAGGRWNHKGIPVLYTSLNSSLAILELLVHLDHDLLPNDLVVSRIFIPDGSIKELSLTDLPKNWRDSPAPDPLKEWGKNWVNANTHLALKVPSAANPLEHNYILNVKHPLFSQVSVDKTAITQLDNRLRK
ncbi:MAG TPA: hypothetical protein DIW47_11770 [Bacteroidetes bacterium]|nr:hypothetical protein [Bacteroidota bacterium]